MRADLRKLALTTHVITSVGWLGAVVVFLVLAVIGLTSVDAQRVRAAYIAMELMAALVIVPSSLASLATGVVSSLASPWGLFRHYWVLAKFALTILATLLLLLHRPTIACVAQAAAELTLSTFDLRAARIQLAADAGAAVLVLLVATALGTYKPSGMTIYGWRKKHVSRRL
jgi:hypothetical protein